MPLDRKDFIPLDGRCVACKRKLREGYVEVTPNGENYYGPECVKAKFSPTSIKNCPNLTSALWMASSNKSPQGSASGGGAGGGGVQNNVAFAYAYLLLRAHSLPQIDGRFLQHNTNQLTALLAQYRANGSLSANDVQSILSIESSAKNELKLDNLKNVYVAARELVEQIKQSPKNPFVSGVFQSLINNLTMAHNLAVSLKIPVRPNAFK